MSIFNSSSKLAKAAVTNAAVEAFLTKGHSVTHDKLVFLKREETTEGTFYHYGTPKALADRNLREQAEQLAPKDWQTCLAQLAQLH